MGYRSDSIVISRDMGPLRLQSANQKFVRATAAKIGTRKLLTKRGVRELLNVQLALQQRAGQERRVREKGVRLNNRTETNRMKGAFSGTEERVITKGITSLEESLEISKKSLHALESLENGRMFLCLSLQRLTSLEALESLENGHF